MLKSPAASIEAQHSFLSWPLVPIIGYCDSNHANLNNDTIHKIMLHLQLTGGCEYPSLFCNLCFGTVPCFLSSIEEWSADECSHASVI